ncbi:MAG TPA: PTS transporter subunit EIIC [Candidatus Levilactobacillus faecigallinarum]|uniref:PTS transporter subunit EIIC n=1 Tax=Candidatus Levilactobacillus faecigallinarum TaxID=2838638 RepID=A0A9D1QS08_9LACO|nr:PTS transporter subunit EIIC [Candidatus Levilactobacillus faecigallinarum]
MVQRVSGLGQWLIVGEVRWRRNAQVAAVYRGLRTVLPLIFLGTLADLVNQAWLQPNGYYFQTLHVAKWLLRRVRLQEAVLLLQNGALGMAVLGLAFAISYHLVAMTKATANDRLTAGFTAILGLEIVNVNPMTLAASKPTQWLAMNLGLNGLVLGIVMGLIVGDLYAWGVGRWTQPENSLVRPLIFGAGGMGVLAVWGTIWLMTKPFSLNTWFTTLVRGPLQMSNTVWRLLDFSALNGCFTALGVLGPLPASNGETMAAAENLATILGHSGGALPHPLTVQTVIQSYASMGGPGMTLGLLVAIFLVRDNADQRRIGWLSLVPVLSNFNAPLLAGLPVILSPLLCIPLILAPLASILLSSFFLALHWVPAAAYPLAVGAPGPLIGFLGTSGAVAPLLLAGVNLAMSTAIYYPFVKWAQIAQRQVAGKVAEP